MARWYSLALRASERFVEDCLIILKRYEMRYITHIPNLVLYNNDGTVAERFGVDGVLKKGTLTTDAGAGNSIDPTNIMKVYETDLDGNTVTTIEIVGQGSLDGLSETGVSVAAGVNPYRLFFKAPPITGGTALSDAVERYIVIDGTVTYNGKTYKAGQIFETESGVTATSGTGTFAAYLPWALTKEQEDNRAKLFVEKSLIKSDDAYTDWSWAKGDPEPYDNLASTEGDFMGYVR